MFRKDRSWFAP